MKNFRLANLRLNSSSWGKLLLAAGLLLVLAQGLVQLYDVQNLFFPGEYREARLNVLRGECLKIEQGLKALKIEVDNLKKNQVQVKALTPGRASSDSATDKRTWHDMIFSAKKGRVQVERKLKYLEEALKSMHRSLVPPLSPPHSALATANPEGEQILQQIQEMQALLRRYDDEFTQLSQELIQLEERGRNHGQSASPGSP